MKSITRAIFRQHDWDTLNEIYNQGHIRQYGYRFTFNEICNWYKFAVQEIIIIISIIIITCYQATWTCCEQESCYT